MPEEVYTFIFCRAMTARSRLHHLRTLRVWDLGNTGIDHIMQLQALRTLHLDLKISSAGESRKSHLSFPGLHNLHNLRLSFGAFEQAMDSDFLSSLEVIRSKEIELVFASQIVESSEGVSTSLFQFLAILPKICDNEKLERLSLVWIEEYTHAISCLHAIACISQFDWAPSTQNQLLYRNWYYRSANIPRAASLALVIDATKLEGINLRSPGGENFSKCLKDLTLGNSIISSPLNVALILSGLFPYLEQVNLDCWDTAPMNSSRSVLHKYSEMEKWDAVNSFLHGFSIVSKHIVPSFQDDG
ncbi:hypothetical protein DFH29DRAFT_1006385 [Suillus ampliporus]|nr:hypothetical protein DFH29DRAFT_1006385 [Suillus ampliporus]